jgi:site-specific recombinase XerD
MKSNVRVHLSPVLGATKLDKLNPFQVQAFYTHKLYDGQSPASVLKVHCTLSKPLKVAVQWRLIPLNPCANVTLPRPAKADVQAFDVKQMKILLEAAEGTDLYALWVVLQLRLCVLEKPWRYIGIVWTWIHVHYR